MLQRIYIDNFKCLVNFELSLDSINVFLGSNGSGKSVVFDALWKIQQFLSGEERVSYLFEDNDLTRWQQSAIQKFELDIAGNEGIYKYEVVIEYNEARQQAHVQAERLLFDDHLLLQGGEKGEIQSYLDDYSLGPVYGFDRSRSSVSSVPPKYNNTKLTWFKERIQRLIILQIMPGQITPVSEAEANQLWPKATNFVSWYRYISQNQGKAFKITQSLQEVLDGFDEMSDGQRVLIVLYILLYATQGEDYTLCIDEPEKFLALSEIQPWLTLLYDLCSEGKSQSLLISHHPEIIDYLASSSGYWFERESNAPVRAKRITTDNGTGLPISELVARGWLHE